MDTATYSCDASINSDLVLWREVQTFLSCPLKFNFSCRRYVEPDRVLADSVFESAMRAAFDEYYRRYFALPEDKSEYRDPLEAYRLWFHSNYGDGLTFHPGDSLRRRDWLAKRMLAAFEQSTSSRPCEALVAVGQSVTAKMREGIPPLRTRADLILEDESGNLIIQELRFTDAPWTEDDLIVHADQLWLLGEMIRLRHDGVKPKLRFLVITKRKKATVQLFDLPFSTKSVERAKAMYAEVWATICQERYFPAPDPLKCSGCGYQPRCAKWRGR